MEKISCAAYDQSTPMFAYRTSMTCSPSPATKTRPPISAKKAEPKSVAVRSHVFHLFGEYLNPRAAGSCWGSPRDP